MGIALFGISIFYIKNIYLKIYFGIVIVAAVYGMAISGTRSAIAIPFGSRTSVRATQISYAHDR